MSDDRRVFAPPNTPGYTGEYEVRGDVLRARQPDGQWVTTGWRVVDGQMVRDQ